MQPKRKVLFLCTGNSCRSQMAEGLLRHYYSNRFEAFSAGIDPTGINPYAIRVMQEIGIDISYQSAKSIDTVLGLALDLVITVCDNANESCPMFPGNVERHHWGFEDPADAQGTEAEILAVFRTVRDQIKAKLDEVFAQR